jgi:hypothetical protein
VRAAYHIDSAAQVRGATCFLHERRFAHASAILESYDELVIRSKPVFLFTGYLMKKLRTTTAREDPGAYTGRIKQWVGGSGGSRVVSTGVWYADNWFGESAGCVLRGGGL